MPDYVVGGVLQPCWGEGWTVFVSGGIRQGVRLPVSARLETGPHLTVSVRGLDGRDNAKGGHRMNR
ncbi:hypothetical protein ARTHRO8AJ_300056 [Arthrobacter sp. 8AJ]|nr:hypothetical protein ARTHRO8AJ_300056 [Arthrobacter sp. 8AJ]